MTSNIEGLIREGIAAFKAGRKDEARVMLSRATELDPHNEQGWLWLSAVVDNVEDQQICLENVIAINPKNTRALQGLELIQKEKGSSASRKYAPPPPPPPPTTPTPNVPGSQLFDSSLPAPSTEAEAGGYHGSGGDVNLPSGTEYDAWVDGLNLGPAEAAGGVAASDPFGFDGPFQQAAPDPDPFAFDDPDVYADTSTYAGDQVSPGREGGGASAPAFDPYAVPQPGGYDEAAYGGSDYETGQAEPIVDEFSDLVDGDFSSAAPFSDGTPSEEDLLAYLEYIPDKIKPTHLPGEGIVYPPSIIAGLVVVSGGVVLALLLLVGQLLF